MKKKNGVVFAFAVIIFLIAGEVLQTAIEGNRRKEIDSMLNVNFLKTGKIYEFDDTHGGFLGDGSTFAIIQYSKDEIIKVLNPVQSHVPWRNAPLPNDILLIPGVNPKENDFLRYHRLPVSNKSGRYYFIDSQLKWDPNSDEIKKPVYERNSFNFTLAILDTEMRRLYLFRQDT